MSTEIAERATTLMMLRDLESAGAITPTALRLPDGTSYPRVEALFAYFGHAIKPARVAWWVERTEWNGDCLLWVKALMPNGYGRGGYRVGGKHHGYYAHRRAYEEFFGPIPTGLQIDHLCRVRACVNPLHLEAVTRRENLRRGVGFAGEQSRQTHCLHGHPLSGENLYEHDGHRYCKTCRLATNRAHYARRHSA